MKTNYTKRVPFELAKGLKEAGFPQDNQHGPWYIYNGKLYFWSTRPGFWEAYAPTYAEVLDWLMEKEVAINISGIFVGPNFVWDWELYTPKFHESDDCYEEFEMAVYTAISKALEILS